MTLSRHTVILRKMASVLFPLRYMRMSVALWILACTQSLAGDTRSADDYVVPKFTMNCDAMNRSWFLVNQHPFRSIQVRLRWHAVGAMEKQEEFVLTPGQERPVGCAPSLEILSARFLEF